MSAYGRFGCLVYGLFGFPPRLLGDYVRHITYYSSLLYTLEVCLYLGFLVTWTMMCSEVEKNSKIEDTDHANQAMLGSIIISALDSLIWTKCFT